MPHYIFLDVDGVLNDNQGPHFDPYCLALLRRIIESCGALIVLSSSWRKYDLHLTTLTAVLQEFGMKIFSQTPVHPDHYARPLEIIEWLRQYAPTVEGWVCLDDMPLTHLIGGHALVKNFVHTHPHIGLTDQLTDLAINILRFGGGFVDPIISNPHFPNPVDSPAVFSDPAMATADVPPPLTPGELPFVQLNAAVPAFGPSPITSFKQLPIRRGEFAPKPVATAERLPAEWPAPPQFYGAPNDRALGAQRPRPSSFGGYTPTSQPPNRASPDTFQYGSWQQAPPPFQQPFGAQGPLPPPRRRWDGDNSDQMQSSQPLAQQPQQAPQHFYARSADFAPTTPGFADRSRGYPEQGFGSPPRRLVSSYGSLDPRRATPWMGTRPSTPTHFSARPMVA
eukprot:TRINITY_DN8299_c0_g1_i2.p1 TRINITY_DN8299_c0_g1~~TRINITY_DN8299_c0_g1_i2.p1  ORF type:complete len:394 (-),score=60.64 TRINITY_DN8299_c0_g1_i2:42-1223(-)